MEMKRELYECCFLFALGEPGNMMPSSVLHEYHVFGREVLSQREKSGIISWPEEKGVFLRIMIEYTNVCCC